MRRRHVLAVVAEAYGSSGGIAQFNRHLLEALAANERLEVRALGLRGPPAFEAPGNMAWSVPAADRKAGFAMSVWKQALTHSPDLVIAGLIGFAPMLAPLTLGRRTRLWTVTHGVEVWEPVSRLDRLGLRGSDLVTTVSRYTRDRLLQWSALSPRRVQVLHNTIDLDLFKPGPRPPELVSRYGVEDRRVLLTVGRLARHEAYKGHDRIISILADLDRRAGPLHYVIAGSGDDRPRLEALARAHGVSDRMTFAGFIPDEALIDYYRLADVFVMPSTGEGFGIVYLEALACGCPVVAGNRDGSVDALADGEIGRLVDPDSPQELLDAVAATLAEGRRHDRAVPGVERFALSHFRSRVDEIVSDVLAD